MRLLSLSLDSNPTLFFALLSPAFFRLHLQIDEAGTVALRFRGHLRESTKLHRSGVRPGAGPTATHQSYHKQIIQVSPQLVEWASQDGGRIEQGTCDHTA